MPRSTDTDKDRALTIVKRLPADCTLDEIIHELAMSAMIRRGLADSKAGRTISTTELKKRVRSWRK